MNEPNYHPDDAKPIKYYLYLIGLVIYTSGMIMFPYGIHLIASNASGSYQELSGRILICLGVLSACSLYVMITHLIHRLYIYHKYGQTDQQEY